MSTTHTTCPYCGVGCGVVATKDNGKVQISGDVNHPANFGRLCAKGLQLGSTLKAEGRIAVPMIHGQPESWGRATAYVANRFVEAIEQHGPDSVAFYLSGQLLTEDYYVANKLMKGFIGSSNVDTNSRLCMSSAVVAHKGAFGSDTVPGCYEDFELADLVVLVGSNLAWCQPVLFQRLMAAKAKRPEMRLVVIDPRQTATTEAADLHLQLTPNSDLTLFQGLLNHLQQHHHVTANGSPNWQAVCESAAAFPIERVCAETGLSTKQLSQFFGWFAQTEKTVTGFSMGSNQSVNGSANGSAIINCHLATNRIGRAGMGPFSITGQPNAMGGREVGGLATAFAAHVGFDQPEQMAEIATFWGSNNPVTKPGLTAVTLFEAMAAGEIKAVWIMGTNPAVSVPDSQLVARALAKCPTVVVSDCVAGTDTQAFADVILPAQGWSEKDGTVTNAERRISRQRGFMSPYQQAKPDWWALCQVAKAMGFGAAFNYQTSAEIFAEHAALSAFNGGPFDISALADLSSQQYQQLPPLQWPQVTKGQLQLQNQRLFAGGVGADFVNAEATMRFGQGRFVLNSGRSRDQWHTMTRTSLAPKLTRHQPLPLLQIHPLDAASLGLTDNDLVQLDGGAVWPLQLSEQVGRGQLFAPIHWSNSNSSVGSVNRHVDRRRDRQSFQPAFKTARVDLFRIAVRSWGQLLLPKDQTPPLAYLRFWVQQRRGDYRLWWFASDVSEHSWRQWLQGVTGDQQRWVDQQGQGLVTLLYRHQDRLSTGLQLAKKRQHLSGDLWHEAVDSVANGELLTQLLGQLPSPLLCACVGVTEAEVAQAITAGAHDAEAVQQACGAGGGCGVCKMEISQRCRQAAALNQDAIAVAT